LVPRRQEEHDREAEEFGFLDERDMLETASAWGWQPGRLAYLFGYQTSTIAKRMRKLKLTNLMYDLKPSDRKELGRQLRAISNLERRT
jgi:hypothetical protein